MLRSTYIVVLGVVILHIPGLRSLIYYVMYNIMYNIMYNNGVLGSTVLLSRCAEFDLSCQHMMEDIRCL